MTSKPILIGMVHLDPLPGSPAWSGSVKNIVDAACTDARALIDNGCHAVIVENMGDVPYLRGSVGAETVAAMAIVTEKIVALGAPAGVEVGVQVLAAANVEAMAIAHAAGAQFIRAEAFAYAHVADEGWIDASAGEVLRARARLGAKVEVWADVQKKHAAHAVTADLSLADLAKGTRFCGADALIVTGRATGEETSISDIEAAKVAGLRVIVGSGVTPANAAALARVADGLIVGTFFKYDGHWRNRVDGARVRALALALRG